VTHARVSRCFEVLGVKEKEYAINEDRLEHIKSAAALLDTTPKIALMAMSVKHFASLNSMSQCNHQNISLWDEKITDSINYLLLLWALVLEEGGVEDGEEAA
jgi:hypothetical protein